MSEEIVDLTSIEEVEAADPTGAGDGWQELPFYDGDDTVMPLGE